MREFIQNLYKFEWLIWLLHDWSLPKKKKKNTKECIEEESTHNSVENSVINPVNSLIRILKKKQIHLLSVEEESLDDKQEKV